MPCDNFNEIPETFKFGDLRLSKKKARIADLLIV